MSSRLSITELQVSGDMDEFKTANHWTTSIRRPGWVQDCQSLNYKYQETWMSSRLPCRELRLPPDEMLLLDWCGSPRQWLLSSAREGGNISAATWLRKGGWLRTAVHSTTLYWSSGEFNMSSRLRDFRPFSKLLRAPMVLLDLECRMRACVFTGDPHPCPSTHGFCELTVGAAVVQTALALSRVTSMPIWSRGCGCGCVVIAVSLSKRGYEENAMLFGRTRRFAFVSGDRSVTCWPQRKLSSGSGW